ncbi:hypothetical protein [Streptomyces sp. T12]|uniref:hypothetical protein n=1 Tax=Streptomyces sp. T12 TaxID=477697 RepID=UPI0027D1F868|nr:hypothetical protein [Streptomyces sp. T12]
MAASSRQAPDHETDGDAGERQQRQRPPPRRGVPTQLRGQFGPQQVLEFVQAGEEPERGEGDRDTDERGEDERLPAGRAPQQVTQPVGF